MRHLVENTCNKSPLKGQFLCLSNILVVSKQTQMLTRMHKQNSTMQSENPVGKVRGFLLDLLKNYERKKNPARFFSAGC